LAGFGSQGKGKPVTEVDLTKTMWMADMGNQFMEANQFVLMTTAA
jgi:hypothetical protein